HFQPRLIITAALLRGVVALTALSALQSDHYTHAFLSSHVKLLNQSMRPGYSLFQDLGDDACTHGEAAFTNGELGALLQCHRGLQLDLQVDVVARHDHLHTVRQGHFTSY